MSQKIDSKKAAQSCINLLWWDIDDYTKDACMTVIISAMSYYCKYLVDNGDNWIYNRIIFAHDAGEKITLKSLASEYDEYAASQE